MRETKTANGQVLKPRSIRSFAILSFLLMTTAPAIAQEAASSGGDYANLALSIFIGAMILLAFMIIVLADKFLQVSAATNEGTANEVRTSLMPSVQELVGTNSQNAAKATKIRQGFDIKVAGKVKKGTPVQDYASPSYSMKPTDFRGIRPIPKLTVAVGDEVKAGDAVFFDKENPEIMYTAPVSGEVVEVRRGAKRAITDIVILADKDQKYRTFDKADPLSLSREQVIERMKESGTWVNLVQRPFGVVASPEANPVNIFVSGFSTAPLTPDLNIAIRENAAAFQAGINALSRLTEGEVHLSLNAKADNCDAYTNAQNCRIHHFEGPHPAGNVGVQIHHIAPINKGEEVWTMDAEDVVTLGRVFSEGVYRPEKLVAVAGPVVKEPRLYRTIKGANVELMIQDNLTEDNVRIVSGDVLTGQQIESKDYMGGRDNVLSVIEEGDFYEMFGWLLPSYARPSLSVTFPWSLFPFEEFNVNTNTHGEFRAFVVTGEYEKVLPMDIYPQHLLKAIIANDFEGMENLGIYELLEEDVALCEFVCTSKQPVQKILGDGLTYMREQV